MSTSPHQARFADADVEKSEATQLETIPSATATEATSKESRYADSTTGLDHKDGVARAERKLLLKMDLVSPSVLLSSVVVRRAYRTSAGDSPDDCFALREFQKSRFPPCRD